MNANVGLFGTLFLSGLLSSLGHCLGMCGPLVMILGLQLGDTNWRTALPRHTLYHLSRVVVYGLLGAIIGAVGLALGLGGNRLTTFGGVISLALGVVIILFGAGYLGWKPLGQIEGAGTWVSKGMSRALKQGGLRGVILLGALNGLLPCCLVYAALLAAASSGGPAGGALSMISFGLGTIPALLIVGLGAGAISMSTRQTLTKAAGVLMMVVGLQLVLRGGAALSLVPHLELGKIVLW